MTLLYDLNIMELKLKLLSIEMIKLELILNILRLKPIAQSYPIDAK